MNCGRLHFTQSAMSLMQLVETDRRCWTSVELGRQKPYTCESSAMPVQTMPGYYVSDVSSVYNFMRKRIEGRTPQVRIVVVKRSRMADALLSDSQVGCHPRTNKKNIR